MNEITRETILQAAREAYDKHKESKSKEPLGRNDFMQSTGISLHYIHKHFPGGWTEIRELVGIERHPLDYPELSDEDLLREFHSAARKLGRIPTWYELEAHSNASKKTVSSRFTGKQGTLRRYCEWLEENEPDSPLLEMLRTKSKHEIIPSPVSASVRMPSGSRASDGTEYGAPINFRGLQHAPINEQGVVYLFGMVSDELGFMVEAVQGAFPDCEAKRCIDEKRQRWQRVRIEFEYRSKHFSDHRHDPDGCDLIVCWEHNWPECPIEVLELRTVIDQLNG